MKFKSFALGGAAMMGLAVVGVPAVAYTHHPATPAERAQTDDLNAQALSQAQGQQTATQQTASASSDMPASGSVSQSAMQPGSAGPSGTVSLTALTNSPQTLADASVETSSGQAVGAVQKVVTDSDGRAQTIDVALLGSQSKIVSIDAAQLAYDQSRNVVVAQLSADQIQALPATPQS